MPLYTTYFGPISWYREIMRTEGPIVIEAHENYVKQTYRNRMRIATANGPQTLSVPTTQPQTTNQQHPSPTTQPPTSILQRVAEQTTQPQTTNHKHPTPTTHHPITQILISDHGNWRHQHWEALKSAYGMSPFFEYYADDIHPFFTQRWERLFDYNLAITHKMLDLIGINKEIILTNTYQPPTPTTQPPSPNTQPPSPNTQPPSPNTQPPSPNHPSSILQRVAEQKEMPDSTPRYYQTFQRRHGFIPDLSILDLLFNEGPESILYLKT